MLEGLEHLSCEEKRRELGHDLVYDLSAGQVVAVTGTAFNTPQVSAVTQTPDSRLPSSLSALLETPLRPRGNRETLLWKGSINLGKASNKKYICRYVFSPLYFRIFAKVYLTLFPTDLSECPTAAVQVFL